MDVCQREVLMLLAVVNRNRYYVLFSFGGSLDRDDKRKKSPGLLSEPGLEPNSTSCYQLHPLNLSLKSINSTVKTTVRQLFSNFKSINQYSTVPCRHPCRPRSPSAADSGRAGCAASHWTFSPESGYSQSIIMKRREI